MLTAAFVSTRACADCCGECGLVRIVHCRAHKRACGSLRCVYRGGRCYAVPGSCPYSLAGTIVPWTAQSLLRGGGRRCRSLLRCLTVPGDGRVLCS